MLVTLFDSLKIATNIEKKHYDDSSIGSEDKEINKNHWGDAIMELKGESKTDEQKETVKLMIAEFKKCTGEDPKAYM